MLENILNPTDLKTYLNLLCHGERVDFTIFRAALMKTCEFLQEQQTQINELQSKFDSIRSSLKKNQWHGVRRFMTTQEAQEILDILKDKESSPEYDDVLQWLEDACKTLVARKTDMGNVGSYLARRDSCSCCLFTR